MNIGRILTQSVKRWPDETALVDRVADVRYTYRRWYDRIINVAVALNKQGISEGSYVGAVMRNREELATVYCATQLLGAVFVPYNFRVSADELVYLVNNSEPATLFFSAETSDAVQTGRDRFNSDPRLVSVDGAHDDATAFDAYLDDIDSKVFDPTFVDPGQTCLVLHTGGTTGDPKAVPRSHTNTYTAATAHAIQTSWTSRESTLGLMSLAHTMGIHALTATILLGGKWVAQRTFSSEETLDLIESESITSLYLVPTVYHDLVKSEVTDAADLSTIDNVAFAGASMSTPDLRAVEAQFDPETFVNHYGSTEVYTHAVCDWVREKPGCVGRPGLNVNLRIVKPSDFGGLDPTATVDTDELGEIIVDTSSPEAFDGYLDGEGERNIVDGWFFTGDLGYHDEDGDLYLTGRVDDMIISGGENIYPVEVENVLESHNLVQEAAVVGRPSERWNQTVAAFITLNEPIDEGNYEAVAETLDVHCRESKVLADFKRPRKYFFIDELSKSNVGKILRKELQTRKLDIHVHAEVDV